ncbi:hypothetical protein ID866_10539, partial [Astraeus odoratus]
MHPHILLNRILRHIFAFIDKRSDLCALARTCRTFNGPATDSLWETLTEISPILQQLSCIEHKYNGTPYIVRELTPEDWQVFRKLSQRPATLEHLRVHLLDATPHDPPRFQIGSPSHHIVSTTMVNLTLLMITYHAPGETNDNLQEFENIVTLTPT